MNRALAPEGRDCSIENLPFLMEVSDRNSTGGNGHTTTIPRGLKPLKLGAIYVRAEARTLQNVAAFLNAIDHLRWGQPSLARHPRDFRERHPHAM
jgi:hypothetical protein